MGIFFMIFMIPIILPSLLVEISSVAFLPISFLPLSEQPSTVEWHGRVYVVPAKGLPYSNSRSTDSIWNLGWFLSKHQIPHQSASILNLQFRIPKLEFQMPSPDHSRWSDLEFAYLEFAFIPYVACMQAAACKEPLVASDPTIHSLSSSIDIEGASPIAADPGFSDFSIFR